MEKWKRKETNESSQVDENKRTMIQTSSYLPFLFHFSVNLLQKYDEDKKDEENNEDVIMKGESSLR